MSRKFVNTRSTKALRDYFALPERPPTSATLQYTKLWSNYLLKLSINRVYRFFIWNSSTILTGPQGRVENIQMFQVSNLSYFQLCESWKRGASAIQWQNVQFFASIYLQMWQLAGWLAEGFHTIYPILFISCRKPKIFLSICKISYLYLWNWRKRRKTQKSVNLSHVKILWVNN